MLRGPLGEASLFPLHSLSSLMRAGCFLESLGEKTKVAGWGGGVGVDELWRRRKEGDMEPQLDSPSYRP